MDRNAADRLVRRILRVDHAGEHGAIAIYSAQIAVLGDRHPELCLWLDETLKHEKRHRAAFREAMPSRRAKPCRALSIWKLGGATLGWLTATLGPDAIMACTAVVERCVHGHLEEQVRFLRRVDPGLAALIVDIQVEEDDHLAFAERNHDRKKAGARAISVIVSAATELLIAISTRGDSLRLGRVLAEAV